MGRKPVDKTCCVCLNNASTNSYRLSKKDENKLTLYTKLKTCVSEIDWKISFYICSECMNLLNVTYNFRETCIKSDFIRKGKKEKEIEESSIVEPQKEILEDVVCKEEKVANEEPKEVLTYYFEPLSDSCNNDNIIDDPTYCSDNEQADSSSSEKEEKCKSKRTLNGVSRKVKEEKKPKRKKKNKFECDQCSSTFPVSTKLVEHCVKDHQMDSKDVKPFACDRCPNKFSTSSNLLQHIKYHDQVRSNICSYCGKGFITKTDLSNHEKKHLNKREYKCEACDKSFNTHKDIRSHRLIVHTDSSKWKFICEICSKPFPIKSNYDSHMRRHTGEKKFACHFCEKRFTTKCDLQRHTTSHSHVRQHRCLHCDKEYKDERVLKVHMAKIHGIGLGKVKIPIRERKYACHFCPKAYYAKNKLTRHLYTHSGEKPFNCPICEKKFNDKSYVKQHLRNTHNHDTNNMERTLENELKISYMDL